MPRLGANIVGSNCLRTYYSIGTISIELFLVICRLERCRASVGRERRGLELSTRLLKIEFLSSCW